MLFALYFQRRRLYAAPLALLAIAILFLTPAHGFAQNQLPQSGGEAHLIIPDLSQGTFLGTSGRTLLISLNE